MMTERDKPPAVDAERLAEVAKRKERLAAKDHLAEALFSGWRPSSEDDGNNAVRMLSYSPSELRSVPDAANPDARTIERHDLDKLNASDQKNADIFTSQRWAAKQAHEVFSILRQDAALEELFDKNDPFQITLIGSSVTGLTFHATLKTLVDLWDRSERDDPDSGFEKRFEIKYIDNHHRPMQRLLQARDRRIIPRFEFETIFDKDFSDGATPTLLPEGDPQLITAWNELKRLTPEAKEMIEGNIEALKHALGPMLEAHVDTVAGGDALFIPAPICWAAGSVRSVARQIEEGFKLLVPDHPFEDPQPGGRGILPSQLPTSTTGGPIYQGIMPLDTAARPENHNRRFALKLAGTVGANDNDQPLGSTARLLGGAGRTRPLQTTADIVLLATGPGVDITTSDHPEGPVALDDGTITNSQDSFWNTPKADLDLVEGWANSVLIFGHSDSAAGAVFSTLLNDPEACSYRLLTDLLAHGGGSVRRWFKELQDAVDEADIKDAASTTDLWDRALKTDAVLEVLYAGTGGKIRNELRQSLRGSVDVSIALRADRGWQVSPTGETTVPPFMLFSKTTEPGEASAEPDENSHDLRSSVALRRKLFRGAWPENRILMALMSPWFELYQIPDSNEDAGPDVRKVRKTTLPGKPGPRNHKTELFEVLRTNRDGSKTLCQFKYVFDCRGPQYFSKGGNYMTAPPLPWHTAFFQWCRDVAIRKAG